MNYFKKKKNNLFDADEINKFISPTKIDFKEPKYNINIFDKEKEKNCSTDSIKLPNVLDYLEQQNKKDEYQSNIIDIIDKQKYKNLPLYNNIEKTNENSNLIDTSYTENINRDFYNPFEEKNEKDEYHKKTIDRINERNEELDSLKSNNTFDFLKMNNSSKQEKDDDNRRYFVKQAIESSTYTAATETISNTVKSSSLPFTPVESAGTSVMAGIANLAFDAVVGKPKDYEEEFATNVGPKNIIITFFTACCGTIPWLLYSYAKYRLGKKKVHKKN